MKAPVFALLVAILVAAVGLPLRAATVMVFAAASLTESLKEIAVGYQKQTGDVIVFNFAASGPLARQIEEGALADVFFSADEARMDALEQQGLIVTETRKSRLSNRLVIVATSDNPTSIASAADLALPTVKRLALGDPKTVPAGTYARTYLENLGLWAGLESRVVPCETVRAVLAAVEAGNVDAGIVYRTDAATSQKVKVVFEVSAQDGPRISYPVALVKEARQPQAARKFLTHLAGPETAAIFTRRGFVLLPPPTAK